jgi:hypothetical protein
VSLGKEAQIVSLCSHASDVDLTGGGWQPMFNHVKKNLQLPVNPLLTSNNSLIIFTIHGKLVIQVEFPDFTTITWSALDAGLFLV